jgi:hypothetical protein
MKFNMDVIKKIFKFKNSKKIEKNKYMSPKD